MPSKSKPPVGSEVITSADVGEVPAALLATTQPLPAGEQLAGAILAAKRNLREFRGRFGKGWVPDPEEVKAKQLSVRHLLGAHTGVGIPSEYSLEKYVLQIYDQGQTSSCTGWAFAQAVRLRLAVQGLTIALPSPMGLYTTARALERQQAGNDAKTALTDSGAIPSDVVAGMQQWGMATSAAWPFDATQINAEPVLSELENASQFMLQGVYRVQSSGAQRIADIQQAIAAGYPVAVGTYVDSAFEDYAKGDKPLPAPNPEDTEGGGHMMHLIGYDANGNFRGVNQWGGAWGDSGMYWASPAWVTSPSMSDIYVITVGATGR
jgi:C1A family cysteine protease